MGSFEPNGMLGMTQRVMWNLPQNSKRKTTEKRQILIEGVFEASAEA